MNISKKSKDGYMSLKQRIVNDPNAKSYPDINLINPLLTFSFVYAIICTNNKDWR